ncbi:MAG: beta strand repeat-containing protein [Acidimicrobiales bacterium]
MAIVLVGLVQLPGADAFANAASATETDTSHGSFNFPGGVVANVTTATVDVPTQLNGVGSTASLWYDPAYYKPVQPFASPALSLLTMSTTCSASGICGGQSTLDFAFNYPVKNPTLHFANIGGGASGTGWTKSVSTTLLGTDPNIPLSVSDGSNLAVSGNMIQAADKRANGTCIGGTAACGSVLANGIVSTLSFKVGQVVFPTTGSPDLTTSTNDGFQTMLTLPQDYGDAPAGYDQADAARATLTSYTLGATASEDAPNDANLATSPNASDDAFGDTDDAFGAGPADVMTFPGASTHSVTVPITHTRFNRAFTVCGWIDFNRDGLFQASERACSGTQTAGATSATLNFSVPAGAVDASTFMRLRIGEPSDPAVSNPTGTQAVGEVEDWPVSLVNGTAALTLTKAAGAFADVNNDGLVGVGDTVAYTFTVANPSASTVHAISLNDPRVGGPVTCPRSLLGSGESMTCGPVTYALTLADVNSGTVDNTATVSGLGPNNESVGDTSSTSSPIPTHPVLTLDKTAGTPFDSNADGLVDAGDTIGYSFVVANAGNVTVTNVAVIDPKIGAVTCAATSLAPGASTNCLANSLYVITAADVSTGAVLNTATANGRDPGLSPVVSNEDSTATPTRAPQPRLSLDKRAGTPIDVNGSGLVDAGDTIAYEFTVTNPGNVPVTTIAVVDDTAGPVSCDATSLTPGASTTCRTGAVYVITAADVSAGGVTNVATATGRNPDGGTVTSPQDQTTTPTESPAPGLVLDKEAGTPSDVNADGLTDVGDRLTFTFTVTNTGNVPITNVGINDPKVGPVTCASTTLAAGATTTCTNDDVYVITAADVSAGRVENTATASGLNPDGGAVTSPQDTSTTPTQTPAPQLSILKRAGTPVDGNGSGLTDAGDTIAYTFTVTNTGNVPVTSVGVNDPLIGSVTCTATSLNPGASTSCSANNTHVVTTGDETAGQVENTATASGTDPDGGAIGSNESSTTTPTQTPLPQLTVDKLAAPPTDVNSSGLTDAGDTIAYSFTVTNTGNVPLTGVAVDDPLAGSVSCAASTLAVGASTNCTADSLYTITAADETARAVTNTATSAGTDPDGARIVSGPDETTTPTQAPAPRLYLAKRAGTPVDVNGSGLTDAGDTIAFTFTVTNTGNVPLTGIVVNDPLVGSVTCAATSLTPDASTSCTADNVYVVTTDDETATKVTNTATASGVDPDNGPVTSNEASTTTPVQTPAAALSLVKRAATPVDVNGSGLTDAGDTIAYSFTVTNTGNVPLSGVAVADPLGGPVTCATTDLAVGASTSCTADNAYVVTAGDEVATGVTNTATASGTDPDSTTATSPEARTTTPVATPQPALAIDKRAGVPQDLNASGIPDAGDTITYTFTVTNTGNVPVTGVSVDDPAAGAVTCNATDLAVGASTACRADADHVITNADEANGSVYNTATARGVDPNGGPVASAPDDTTTPVVTPDASLLFDKRADAPVDVNGSGLTDAGDTIAYSFTVTNVGNVPLTTLTVTDPLLGSVTCGQTSLAPGRSTICTADAPWTVTEADETAGAVVNAANVAGLDPDGGTVTSNDDTETTPVQSPSPLLQFDKRVTGVADGNASRLNDAGDTIGYEFTVTNIGNVPITDVAVVDPLIGSVTCQTTVLAPGQATGCTGDARYMITEADEVAGRVDNQARATGLDPDRGAVTSEPDDTTTPVTTPAPSLVIDKRADAPVDVNGDGLTDAGDTIAYTFTVTNTGNVPVTSVGVNDPMVGSVTCDLAELAPREATECAADAVYVVTAADVEAGMITNTANGVGTDPDGGDVVSPPDSVTTATRAPAPQVRIDKFAGDPVDVNDDGLTDAGDTIAYTFTVTNTGNVPVAGVAVNDAKAGPVTCEATELAPGEATDCAADEAYVITAEDEDAGTVHNVATASATDPDGGEVVSQPDDTSTRADPARPRLSFIKKVSGVNDVNDSGFTDAGDEITWTFTVTNDGNIPLASVGVSDAKIGDVVCEQDRLKVDESTTCRSVTVHTVTAADAATGRVHNSAVASADGGMASREFSNVDTTDTLVARPGTTKPETRIPVSTDPTRRVPAAATPRGSLAYTGLALGGLVMVGIGLAAAGVALVRPRRTA